MVQVYVIYEGTREDRFDRDYYLSRHLPLVMSSWSQYGLLSLRAFFPEGELSAKGLVAICDCRFRDQAAANAAFASPEAEAVMADVANFTNLEPQRLRLASGEASR